MSDSQQPTAGLTSHFTSSLHLRPLVPNKDSVAADFYLPLTHHGVMATNCWVVEKNTCAAAPNFYLLAEYICAPPKNLFAVA
jgi:hypothetical protein